MKLEIGSILYHRTPDENFQGFREGSNDVVYLATDPSTTKEYHEHVVQFTVGDNLGKVGTYGDHLHWGYQQSPDGKGYWISMPSSLAAERLNKRE